MYAHRLTSVTTAVVGSASDRTTSIINPLPRALVHRLNATAGKSDQTVLMPQYRRNRNIQGFRFTHSTQRSCLLANVNVARTIRKERTALSAVLPSSTFALNAPWLGSSHCSTERDASIASQINGIQSAIEVVGFRLVSAARRMTTEMLKTMRAICGCIPGLIRYQQTDRPRASLLITLSAVSCES